jgi:hypothetical protein
MAIVDEKGFWTTKKAATTKPAHKKKTRNKASL